MRARALALLAALPFAAGTATAAPTATHCRAGETDFFSCTVEGSGKVVSLCGQDGAKPSLQYRFGRVGRPLELQVPVQAGDAAAERDLFRYESGVTRDHTHAETEVWFRRGDTVYDLTYEEDWADGNAGTEKPDATRAEIQVWTRMPPSGRARVLACVEPGVGSGLYDAEPLVGKLATPGVPWHYAPLDLAFMAKKKP